MCTEREQVLGGEVGKEVDDEPGLEVVFGNEFVICDQLAFFVQVGRVETDDDVAVKKDIYENIKILDFLRKRHVPETQLPINQKNYKEKMLGNEMVTEESS